MNAYYDTGALVPLYITEVFSMTVHALTRQRSEAIPFSAFHYLECENAARLRRFRGDIDEPRLHRMLQDIHADIEYGRLVLRPANWIAALDSARQISEASTVKTGCRTLDLIHVAIAVQWDCSDFVSADERQLKAAKSQGLKVVDIRKLHRGRPRGPGTVRERRAPYRTKKKRARRE